MLNRQHMILAWKNIKARKKQMIRTIILFSVSLCLLAFTILLGDGVQECIEYYRTETPDHRTLEICDITHEGAEEILNYYIEDERVQDVIITKNERSALPVNMSDFTDETVESCVYVKGFHKGIGAYSEYEEDLQKWEIIIPQYFNPDFLQGGDESIYTYRMKFIDATEWIGKELVVSQRNVALDGSGNIVDAEGRTEFTLKIVGTYDNLRMCEYNNYVFTSPETINQMYDDCMDETLKNSMFYDSVNITVIAKEKSDVKQLEKESELEPIVYGYDADMFYEFFMNGLKAVAIILFVAAIVNVALTMSEEIRERRREIALLRAIGYENNKIALMLLHELVILICVVVLVVAVGAIAFVYVGNWSIVHLAGTMFQSARMVFDIGLIVKILVIGVVAMLMTFAVTYYKMEQVNTVEVLKEEG